VTPEWAASHAHLDPARSSSAFSLILLSRDHCHEDDRGDDDHVSFGKRISKKRRLVTTITYLGWQRQSRVRHRDILLIELIFFLHKLIFFQLIR